MNTSTTFKPWERRLDDLAHILNSCSASYFDPELFRRNTNNFLQTARTITFLIQKNKNVIPDFDSFYTDKIQKRMKEDPIMKWAVDARNKIEKQGDLELNSELNVSLMNSYLVEEDIHVEIGKKELLHGDLKKLLKYTKKVVPKSFQSAAGIKIERKWVCSEIRDRELLQTLTYIYTRLYEACEVLAKHLKGYLPDSIASSEIVVDKCISAKYISLVKLKDKKTYRIKSAKVTMTRDDFNNRIATDKKIAQRLEVIRKNMNRVNDFNSLVEYHELVAAEIFNAFGNHQHFLFFYAADYSLQLFIKPVLLDRIDKYFFWRLMGEQANMLQPTSIVFVGEAWNRRLAKDELIAIDDLEITGEILNLVCIDRDGNFNSTEWNITKTLFQKPEINLLEQADKPTCMSFLIPIIIGMGLSEDMFVDNTRV